MISKEELSELISLNTFNDTSLFTVSVVDLSNYQVVYANQAMKNVMADMTATNCWEMIHGQDAPCMWCKAPSLVKNLAMRENTSKASVHNDYAIYENFNEVANKWYQVQEKVVILKDNRKVIVSFALDISAQKEAQSNLIDTHVKLANQTEALKKAQAALKDLANRDPLTNLYNRRYLNEIASNIIAVEKRSGASLSILMIDIDKFKDINDTHGHSVGDDAIKFLANKLREYTRESDLVARLGGEEFVIILTNTDIDNALNVAETLRKDIEDSSYKSSFLMDPNSKLKLTVSIGVDAFNYEKDLTIHNSIDRADKALYLAKESGRNRVC